MAYPSFYPGQPQPMPMQYPFPAPQGQLEALRAAQGYQVPMPAQTAPQAPQSAGQGILWVQGEAGAKAYVVAPGASVLLMDAEGSAFYIKATDPSGMPLPLRIFDYHERTAQSAPAPAAEAAPRADYATREELTALAKRLDELENVRRHNEKGGQSNGKRNLSAAQPE